MKLSPLLLFITLVACGKKHETTVPEMRDITEAVYASGVIKSVNQYQVFSPANGIIRQIFLAEGDHVKLGQAIMQIDNDAAQISEANARLAAGNASVAANTDKLNELKVNIGVAKLRMQNDSSLLQRQRALWAQEIGTRNDVDSRELQYKNSTALYEAALSRYNDLLKQLKFAARQAENNLQISRTTSNDYTIKSNTNGRLYKLLKEPGEMVNMQTPVAIIGQADDFILELQVDEYDISKIRMGQEVLVTMDSYKDGVFRATISKIDPIMNERTRAFVVEAYFTQSPPKLFPNLTAEANIIIQTKKQVLTVPRSYLMDGQFVLLEKQKRKRVTIGLKDYEIVEITSGLSKNDVIYKP